VTTAVASDPISIPNISPTIVSEVCAPALILGVRLRYHETQGDSHELERRADEILDRIEERLRVSGLSHSDVSDVVFALVAFLDESVVSSDWEFKADWLVNPLQFRRFGREDAGEEFFTRLTAIRGERTVRADVLQVYYLCLALGFKGRYALMPDRELDALRTDVGSQLRRLERREYSPLAPHGRAGEELAQVVKQIPIWVFAVAGVAMAFCLYATLTLVIASKLGAVQRLLS
jgi:type VI secretion system protein ImpK